MFWSSKSGDLTEWAIFESLLLEKDIAGVRRRNIGTR
jgi:hypothetical protein